MGRVKRSRESIRTARRFLRDALERGGATRGCIRKNKTNSIMQKTKEAGESGTGNRA